MKRFLTEEGEACVMEAIRAFESATSAELRVCVTYRWIWRMESRAWRAFRKLGMHKTADRNGILILIAPRAGRFFIVGDSGVHQPLGDAFWRSVAEEISVKMSDGSPEEALRHGIALVREKVAALWPHDSRRSNELPDEIAEI